MAGWTRDLGRIRALGAGPALSALLVLTGCQLSSAPTTTEPATGSASGGSADAPPPSVVGPSTGGAVGIAGGFNGGQLSCAQAVSGGGPVFETQLVLSTAPARVELYSWLTDEQALAVRTDQQPFEPLAQPNFNGTNLRTLTLSGDPDVARLATILSGEQFASGRIAWPEPWAIRTTLNGADPGRNLLRFALKPEAWIVVLAGGSLWIVDTHNQPVLPADAAASPARIGAIFYEHDLPDGGPDCNQPPGSPAGYRAFFVGNLAMVQEWSLGTQVIQDRLRANVSQLTEFFNRTRSCPNEVSSQFWNQDVACSWDTGPSGGASEQIAYMQTLAIPNDQYSTSPPELAALIDKLQGDPFQLDPLVVTPGSP